MEESDYVEITYDGVKLHTVAVREERIFLGEVDKKKLERVEELHRKGLLKATPYKVEPEGKALCPMCGDSVFEDWTYYVGHYYHGECFRKHYRKFW